MKQVNQAVRQDRNPDRPKIEKRTLSRPGRGRILPIGIALRQLQVREYAAFFGLAELENRLPADTSPVARAPQARPFGIHTALQTFIDVAGRTLGVLRQAHRRGATYGVSWSVMPIRMSALYTGRKRSHYVPALDRNKQSRREDVTGREDIPRRVVPVAETVEAEIVELPQDEIALLAYSYWEERGRPEGSPEEDWYRAETELRKRRAGS